MRTLERQFYEPHAYWDWLMDRLDEEYRELVEGKTCLDCAKCVKSDRFPCGFCTEDGEMRYEDNVPERDGMECFVGRA